MGSSRSSTAANVDVCLSQQPTVSSSSLSLSPAERSQLYDYYTSEIHRLEKEKDLTSCQLSLKQQELRKLQLENMIALETIKNQYLLAMNNLERENTELRAHELKQLKEKKSKQLSNSIAELTAVCFIETRLFMQEDIDSRVMRYFDQKYSSLSTILTDRCRQREAETLQISTEEHNKTLERQRERFAREIEALEIKVERSKPVTAAGVGGIFSWFASSSSSSGSKRKSESLLIDEGESGGEEEEELDILDVIDSSAESTSAAQRRRSRRRS